MAVRVVVVLMMLMLLLVGCLGVGPNHEPTSAVAITVTSSQPLLIQDAGRICFYTYDAAIGKLEGKFQPRGCYSSSCTRILEQSMTTSVDEQTGALRLKSTFVLLNTRVISPEHRECTADCDGGGAAPVVFERLTGERYTVFLGTESLGEIALAEVNRANQPVCLGVR